jgi:hypothetical protein
MRLPRPFGYVSLAQPCELGVPGMPEMLASCVQRCVHGNLPRVTTAGRARNSARIARRTRAKQPPLAPLAPAGSVRMPVRPPPRPDSDSATSHRQSSWSEDLDRRRAGDVELLVGHVKRSRSREQRRDVAAGARAAVDARLTERLHDRPRIASASSRRPRWAGRCRGRPWSRVLRLLPDRWLGASGPGDTLIDAARNCSRSLNLWRL